MWTRSSKPAPAIWLTFLLFGIADCGGKLNDEAAGSGGWLPLPSAVSGTAGRSMVQLLKPTGGASSSGNTLGTTVDPSTARGGASASATASHASGGASNSAVADGGVTANTTASHASGGASTTAFTNSGGASTSAVGNSGGASSMSGSGGISVASSGSRAIKAAPACTRDLNLLSLDLGPNVNWLGGDVRSNVDDPCEIQGQIYIFGDKGPDEVAGTADDSCPFMDQSVSPCSNARCCVRGTTHRAPVDEYGKPKDWAVWGCGIGISLNDPYDGNGTRPYTGPVVGFAVAVSGNLNGQAWMVGYTQIATDSTCPYRERTRLVETEVLFTDVQCPNWANDCVSPGSQPHALQVWVAGGTEGDFEFCIDAIRPLLL